MCDQRRVSSHARIRCGRLTPRVAAVRDDDVIGVGGTELHYLAYRTTTVVTDKNRPDPQ